jgi:NDP-sugar pyrophosphorylase family protein
MKKALIGLKKQIAKTKAPKLLTTEQWKEIATKSVVILMAGGESTRFKEVVDKQDTNKNAFTLPNGDTMIEMAIRMYKNAGITKFVALLYHKSETIENLLGDGSKYGVEIKYSYDPGPVGKGGAMKHAFENGSIPANHYVIVQNPDDVFIGFEREFPRYIMSAHVEGERMGCVATVVTVGQTPYTFTGMKINKNFVEQIEMYPMIPIPTHVGSTVLSPQVDKYFKKYFSYEKKADFEKVLFPILSKSKKLYSCTIPADSWIAVNNAKSYKQLLEKLS